MDDLAELQALLGAVQKQETKNRLNERNCRELLVKLIQKDFVQVRRACVRRGLVLTAGSLARVRVLTAHQSVPARSAFPLEKVWSHCQHRRGQPHDFTHFRHVVQRSCSVDSSGPGDMITNFLQL